MKIHEILENLKHFAKKGSMNGTGKIWLLLGPIFFLLIAIVIASIPLKLYTVDFSSPPHTDDFGYIL